MQTVERLFSAPQAEQNRRKIGAERMTRSGAADDPAERTAPGEDARSVATSQARILVVDDDRVLAALVGRELHALGYTVDLMELAEDALVAARTIDYALLIIDLGLPDRDGTGLVRELRYRAVEAPILMLTARGKLEDRVNGLASGADDYLVKPFAVPELRARVAALLRRPSRIQTRRVTVGNVVVDRDSLEAVVDGASLPLALKQFQLLDLLARRKNHMTPKRMIEEALYDFSDEVSSNTIEAHVYKLRQALRASGADVTIETRRGIGYRLVERAPSQASDA
jgi:DNA-binding response OmpR family regulator